VQRCKGIRNRGRPSAHISRRESAGEQPESRSMSCDSSSQWQTRLKSFSSAKQTLSLVPQIQLQKPIQSDYLSAELTHDTLLNRHPLSVSGLTKTPVSQEYVSEKWTEEFIGKSDSFNKLGNSVDLKKLNNCNSTAEKVDFHPINSPSSINSHQPCSRKHCKAKLDFSSWDWNAQVAQSLLSHLGIVQAAKNWEWTPSKHYEVDSDLSDCSETASLHEDSNSIQDATRRLQQLWNHLLKRLPETAQRCDCEVDKPVCVDPKDALRQVRLAGLVHELYLQDLGTGRHSPLFLPE
jgi:hypothetical protein